MNTPTLLYGFAQGATTTQIREACGRQRICVEFPHNLPSWAKHIRGQPFVLQTLYGEYGGFVGSGCESTSQRTAEDIEQALKSRHPDWSAAKIARAAQESTAHSQRIERTVSALKIKRETNLASTMRIVTELTQIGDVALVLSLGECIEPATMKHPVTVKSEDIDASFLLSMPPDTPIVITRK
jgi:hypothetical protein